MSATNEERGQPILSVVIPTYNRLQRLRRVLEALARQTAARDSFEVIVVSDGSSDGTDEYLTAGNTPLPILFAQQDNQGPGVARNCGVGLAGGKLVLFLDDDVIPLPELICEHVRAHGEQGGKAVVLGPMLSPTDHKPTPWVRYEQAMLYKQYAAMTGGLWQPTARQFYTGNASLARRHVVEAGGFDSSFSRAEDVELAYRLAARGLRFVFEPAAAGLHYAEREYASWRRSAYLYGRNDVIFARDKGQDWLLSAVPNEFAQHHRFIQLLTRAAVKRPGLSSRLLELLDRMASRPMLKRLDRIPQGAFSAVFNVTYYQGIVDELGSSQSLFESPMPLEKAV